MIKGKKIKYRDGLNDNKLIDEQDKIIYKMHRKQCRSDSFHHGNSKYVCTSIKMIDLLSCQRNQWLFPAL